MAVAVAGRSAIFGNAILNKNNLFHLNRNNLSPARLRASNLSGKGEKIRLKSFKLFPCSAKDQVIVGGESVKASEQSSDVDKVSAVLFDMDGVLCNSEEASRLAAVDVFLEMGVEVTQEDFIPFMGTGEANFLGGVAKLKGVKNFDPVATKQRFYEIYLANYAKPNLGLGYPGSLELILQCKKEGLKVAVASSADRKKVNANMAAAGLPLSNFDAIISADLFENLKPAPDIFLAAAKALDVPPNECVVIEDAVAGIQAANAAKMRCIAVTTTLSEERLTQAGSSLVRRDIGSISLSDILNSRSPDEKIHVGNQWEVEEKSSAEGSSVVDIPYVGLLFNGEISLPGGVQTSRRDLLRLGSLGVAVTCSFVVVTHWKAMSYISPRAILNLLAGRGQPLLAQNDVTSPSSRIQQFKSYISDIEARGKGQEVPEFPPKLNWLNAAPLRLRRIAVVGVHSAKFDNEKDLDAIRNAVLRYGITHPVVNDGDMILWHQLGVNSWPTFAIVSPNGKLLAQLAGEGHRQDLDDLVEAALQFYGEKELLDDRPIPEVLEKDKDTRLLMSPLKFPGKLAADITNNRLFISDSNNHRIVVTDLEGSFIMQVGGNEEEALRDGTFEYATFNRPQGLAYDPKKNTLYVADTENHALREINFVSETVRTLAGNGVKGSDYKGGRKGMAQVLNSPWDVCVDSSSGIVYIAMAGQHQIWKHNIVDGVTRAFSGDGYERNLNGSNSTSTSFAQPSGISLSPDMQELYVADSESSSIRAVNLKTGGSRLLAGGDPLFADNLFQFGDRDGTGTEAQFQHPLGVLCGSDGLVYIADSYNHKIRVLDTVTRKVKTLAGTGNAGFKDGVAQFAQLSEPAGICERGKGKLLIADTNNNIIRSIDLSTENPVVQTLELKGVQVPSTIPKSPKRLRRRPSMDAQIIRIKPISAMKGNLRLEISLLPEYHFTKEASSKFEAGVEPSDGMLVEPMDGTLDSEGFATLHFTRSAETSATVRVNCKVYYCKEDEVCLYQNLAFEVPFIPDSNSTSTADIPLSHTVKPKNRV
ncbi:protein SUPPRESSOR OF QUENCHING 1, chloroplastic isoform X2 [Cryptomeria japonica]|uniref:protein SUPPRESSOR OF QUENCHING 1, chloroplastic isoform X2 n=1 Tax=Cryptomeria japonica TaxID=3369 RepID=UPI0027D9E61B|nr:protein SUPPRESSOR OF QUENCHING 1, chloroplastic isoform X2 [Cryptomeria japonica]